MENTDADYRFPWMSLLCYGWLMVGCWLLVDGDEKGIEDEKKIDREEKERR